MRNRVGTHAVGGGVLASEGNGRHTIRAAHDAELDASILGPRRLFANLGRAAGERWMAVFDQNRTCTKQKVPSYDF